MSDYDEVDLPIGDLGSCPCSSGSTPKSIAGLGSAPARRPLPALAPAKKPRKPRSKGTGQHCVLSHKGRVVHCYEDRSVAERVAAAFTSRGKAGTRFRVGKRPTD